MPEGTLELPDPSDVRSGVQYGGDGTEFTGTFSPGGRGNRGPGRLLNERAYVLEFLLAAEPNMDAHRSYRRRATVNEEGAPVKECVPCRVSLLGSNELVLHSMRGSEVTHRVYFTANPNLSAENRLEIGGVQYLLLGIPQNPSRANRLWQLDVKAISHQNELVKVLE